MVASFGAIMVVNLMVLGGGKYNNCTAYLGYQIPNVVPGGVTQRGVKKRSCPWPKYFTSLTETSIGGLLYEKIF